MSNVHIYLKSEDDAEDVAERVRSYLAEAGVEAAVRIGEADPTLGMGETTKRTVARRIAEVLGR